MYKFTWMPDRNTKPAPKLDLEGYYRNWLDMIQRYTQPANTTVPGGNEGYLGHEYSMVQERPGFGSGSSGANTGYGPGHQEVDPNNPSGIGGLLGGFVGGPIGGILGKAWDAKSKANYEKKLSAHERKTLEQLNAAREAYAIHAAKERAAQEGGYKGGSGGFEGSQGVERLSGV